MIEETTWSGSTSSISSAISMPWEDHVVPGVRASVRDFLGKDLEHLLRGHFCAVPYVVRCEQAHPAKEVGSRRQKEFRVRSRFADSEKTRDDRERHALNEIDYIEFPLPL